MTTTVTTTDWPARPEGGLRPLLVTGRQAAQMLAVSERTLWGMSIARVRVGKRGVRYDVSDLQRWIDSRKSDVERKKTA